MVSSVVSRNCSAYQGEFWLQKDGTAMGPKNACSHADIIAEYVDDKVLHSKTTYPELCSWFRFRDDTFVLWRGAIERLNGFFATLNAFDKHLQFTMDVGGKSLHFLDLLITIKGNSLVTSVYSKNAHLYLDARLCRPRSQISGIAKGVALRIWRISSEEDDFRNNSEEYANFLIACGHDKHHVRNKFAEDASMTRQEARKVQKRFNRNLCVCVCVSSKYNPKRPDV